MQEPDANVTLDDQKREADRTLDVKELLAILNATAWLLPQIKRVLTGKMIEIR